MKHIVYVPAFLVFLAACSPSANAQLVIDGTFGSTITSLPDASTVEAGIDQAISRLEAAIETPITVNIDFEDSSVVDLGQSNTYFNPLPYSQYLSDLENNQTLSANDRTALASLPSQTDNPVNGNPDVELTLPLLRAIGEASLGDNSITPGQLDSTISLNLSEMNVSRTGMQNPDDYDLQAVATHELDEVLGIGGAGSQLNAVFNGDATISGTVGPLDLFRYSAPGVRSYTTAAGPDPYFSINGGNTKLVYFNQNGSADDSDFGDWGNGTTGAVAGNTPPQIQDAFGTQGVDVNLGTNELIALDIVGYTLEPVPEPRSYLSLVLGALILIGIRRRLVHTV